MLIWSLLLQYLPTTEFKTALPALSNPPTQLLCCARYVLASLHWLPICHRVIQDCLPVYRSLHETTSTYRSSVFHAYTPTQSLRSSFAHLAEPRLRTTLDSCSFRPAGPRIWNSPPNDIQLARSFSSFKSKLKTYLFTSTQTITGHRVNSPCLRFDVIFNFVHVEYV